MSISAWALTTGQNKRAHVWRKPWSFNSWLTKVCLATSTLGFFLRKPKLKLCYKKSGAKSLGAAGFRQLSIPVDAKKRFRSQDKVVKMHGRKITANKLGNVQQRKNFQTQPSPFKKSINLNFAFFVLKGPCEDKI